MEIFEQTLAKSRTMIESIQAQWYRDSEKKTTKNPYLKYAYKIVAFYEIRLPLVTEG